MKMTFQPRPVSAAERDMPVPLIAFDLDLPCGRISLDAVIFLDFDGVIHPEFPGDSPFCWVPQFHQALRSCDPEGVIPLVVSSTWRLWEGLHSLRNHFPADLAQQIVGVTPELPERPASVGGWGMQGGAPSCRGVRQAEIEAWMRENAPAGQWLALDDRASLFQPGCPNLYLAEGVLDQDGSLSQRLYRFIREAAPTFLQRDEGPTLPRPPGHRSH